MTPAENPYAAPMSADPVGEKSRSDTAWALAFGIISLFFCAPLFAPLSILRARRVLKRGPDGLASLALVLAMMGILSCVIGFALFAFFAIWQYLSPARVH